MGLYNLQGGKEGFDILLSENVAKVFVPRGMLPSLEPIRCEQEEEGIPLVLSPFVPGEAPVIPEIQPAIVKAEPKYRFWPAVLRFIPSF